MKQKTIRTLSVALLFVCLGSIIAYLNWRTLRAEERGSLLPPRSILEEQHVRKKAPSHNNEVPASSENKSQIHNQKPQFNAEQSLHLQYAAAIRDANFLVISKLMSENYGHSNNLDGLIIEGARKLALSGRPEYIRLSFLTLASSLRKELSLKSNQNSGKLVHIAESLGAINTHESTNELVALLEDLDLPRVVKGAAVQSLAEQNATTAIEDLESYRIHLMEELATAPGSSDLNEKAFIADSLAELDDALLGLKKSKNK